MSKMNLDDPKLTAYALGELSPAEAAEIEKLLKEDEAARAFVEETRAFGQSLSGELAKENETAPGLTAEQKAKIGGMAAGAAVVAGDTAKTGGAGLRARHPQSSWMPWGIVGFAAAVLATVTLGFAFLNNRQADRVSTANKSAPTLVDAAFADAEGESAKGNPKAGYVFDTGKQEPVVPIPGDWSKLPSAAPKAQTPPGDHFETVISTVAPVKTSTVVGNMGTTSSSGTSGGGTTSSSGSSGMSMGVVTVNKLEGRYGPPAPGVVDGPTPSSQRTVDLSKDTVRKEEWLKRNGQRLRVLTGKDAINLNDAFAALKGKAADSGKKAPTWRDLNEKAEINGMLASIQEIDPQFNTEQYNRINENPFKAVRGEDAVSTFGIDVDTASYSNTRRYLNQGMLPPADAVRIEELVNYFDYDYAPPTDDVPFSSNIEVAECPWDPAHRLVRVGLKGKVVEKDKRPATNLVFLIDVSGSMDEPNKLPLVQESLRMLVNQLGENDKVAIVVYAGNSGMVLPSTRGSNRQAILDVLDRLKAGGSTNGGQGIELAYKTAADAFIKGGVNRVILCTDGDWNVGVTNQGDLTRLIEEKAKSGVFLSVLGFGMGNLKDATMEQLADKGNGHYGYIDTTNEAKKMFVEQLSGTLVTIAKDVKIQVEFNPAVAGAYRLIGYENRLMAREDFNDDKKDAGEIGAGHTVTALYEVVPADLAAEQDSKNAELKGQLKQFEEELKNMLADKTEYTEEQLEKRKAQMTELEKQIAEIKKQLPVETEPLKYQAESRPTAAASSGELLTLKLRYKAPDGQTSKLIEFPVKDSGKGWKDSTKDYRFASAVAAYGMMLRGSQFKGLSNWMLVYELAAEARGTDANGYRAEFLELVKKAEKAAKAPAPVPHGGELP